MANSVQPVALHALVAKPVNIGMESNAPSVQKTNIQTAALQRVQSVLLASSA
jgi:hypothetical protein